MTWGTGNRQTKAFLATPAVIDKSLASHFMNTVTALEAKTRLGELLDRVARGEEIVITRHQKPVARMVPEGGRNLAEIRNAVSELRALQEVIQRRSKGKATLSDAEVRDAIGQGRL